MHLLTSIAHTLSPLSSKSTTKKDTTLIGLVSIARRLCWLLTLFMTGNSVGRADPTWETKSSSMVMS